MLQLKSVITTLGVFFLFAVTAAQVSAQKRQIPLLDGWRFHEATKQDWHPATVPGCVHTDLLANKLIEDPFYRDNEAKLQWIGKTDWDYQTTFVVTPEMLRRLNSELVFEGLDTYAEVSLNGALILKADNMFRTWRVSVKNALKPGENVLAVHFRSPVNEILPVMAKMKYELPASNDQGEKTSPHTRKAPYHYGWDWGPRFVTSGIWKPVTLELWDEARVGDLQIQPHRVEQKAANLTASVEVFSAKEQEATVILDNLTGKSIAGQTRVRLAPGLNQVHVDFVIQQPKLWWPNGLGAQPRYQFQARLLLQGKLADQATVRTGLRSLELRQTVDEWGKSFKFIINGVPVFAKGGNWIPADSFPTRITPEKYRWLLESVRDSNMNMLRVWGGGIYESNEFYELCDEFGIMVWQDFMFACSMYPGHPEFLENIRQEAIDNVKRLRKHPSIALWCGNNEIETAWQHWGWKQNLPVGLWSDYLKIFHGVLPEVVRQYDPTRTYWPSSPSSNLEEDAESSTSGDLHYWQVWHASKPFSEYEKQFPRFMSEYGFQSFPVLETVKTYAKPEDYDIESPIMMAHQRHPRGNPLVREYMLREFKEPKDFPSFLYVSQILQAEGIKIGAEHLRRIMPRNMGSLYWQVDDCWPVASWSSIDYTGRWKALQYYSRRFYQDLLVSLHEEGGKLNIYVVSDRMQPFPAQLSVSLLDFNGRVFSNQTKELSVAALDSKSYSALSVNDLLAGQDKQAVFVRAELLAGGKPVAGNSYFFAPYKDLTLPAAKITTEVKANGKGYSVTLKSAKLARGVHLTLENGAGFFADNFFDLLPGRPLLVEFRTAKPPTIEEFRRLLRVSSLTDAF